MASPTDCQAENFIANPYTFTEQDDDGRLGRVFYHPVSTNGTAFACVMRDSNGVVGHKTLSEPVTPKFAEVMDPAFSPPPCKIYEVSITGKAPKNIGALCTETT